MVDSGAGPLTQKHQRMSSLDLPAPPCPQEASLEPPRHRAQELLAGTLPTSPVCPSTAARQASTTCPIPRFPSSQPSRQGRGNRRAAGWSEGRVTTRDPPLTTASGVGESRGLCASCVSRLLAAAGGEGLRASQAGTATPRSTEQERPSTKRSGDEPLRLQPSKAGTSRPPALEGRAADERQRAAGGGDEGCAHAGSWAFRTLNHGDGMATLPS